MDNHELKLTGVPELDFKIYLRLDIESLQNLCNVDPGGICNDDYFWKSKFNYDNLPIMSDISLNLELWIWEYRKVRDNKDQAKKILIINNIECQAPDYNTQGIIQLDLSDQIEHIWSKFLPDDIVIEVKKLFDDHIISSEYSFTVEIIHLNNDEYRMSYGVYDVPTEEEYGEQLIFTYEQVMDILIKALYYDIRVSDIGFKSGIDFVITGRAPDEYSEIEKLYYYRRLGIWDSFKYLDNYHLS